MFGILKHILLNHVSQSMVIQLSVKEAIVPTSSATGATNRDIDLAKVRALLDRCGIVVTERKPSERD